MDLGKAFSFVFDDSEWIKKVLIAAAVSLIPVIGQIVVLGWGLTITQRVIRKEAELLPDWSSFGEYLGLGFKGFVVMLAYMIPVFILTAPSSILASFSDSETMATVIMIVSILCSCLTIVYSILLALLLPAAFGLIAETESIGAGFKLGDIFTMVKDNISAYLMVLVGMIGAGFIGGLGAILCVVGILATQAYSMAVNSHLIGQAYLKAKPGAAFEGVPAELQS
ncbi:MAG: DUF4013 domain-containing protein [Anaerolineales bacterium]|nr:DUF4013 domain-containing protein [Anaerolineales bacterium]